MLCRQCDICKDIIPFEQGVDKAKYLTITDDNKTYKNLDICEKCYCSIVACIERLTLAYDIHKKYSKEGSSRHERGESMSGTQKDT